MSPNYCLTCDERTYAEGQPVIVAPDGKVLAYHPIHMHEDDYAPEQPNPLEEKK